MEKSDEEILWIIEDTLLFMGFHSDPRWKDWIEIPLADVVADTILPLFLSKLPEDILIDNNFKRILSKIHFETISSRKEIPFSFPKRFYPFQLTFRIYYTDDAQIEHELYNDVVVNRCLGISKDR